MDSKDIVQVNSIEEFVDRYQFSAPTHPLFFISRIAGQGDEAAKAVQFNLYSIAFKTGVKGKSKYGWREYDFSKGLLNFLAPGQILSWNDSTDHSETTGWLLIFHPDFIRKYPLAQSIGKYKFFSYDTNEALHLSEAERKLVESIFENIQAEYNRNLDAHSQDIIVSQLEVLLNYGERFYKRQFTTRNSVESDVLTRFEAALHRNFQNSENKFVTAGELASELSMSTHYLSELLRNLTGMSTQQHIHAFLIDKAKSLLKSTDLSVNEIAYKLGFEYPQYFNRLFKSKTGHTPVEFRNLN
jgi:AraC family transcriptional regulator, transcriptional activator of pobA